MFTMDRELRFFRTKIKKWECMFFRLRGRGRFFFCMWMEEECFGEWESVLCVKMKEKKSKYVFEILRECTVAFN